MRSNGIELRQFTLSLPDCSSITFISLFMFTADSDSLFFYLEVHYRYVAFLLFYAFSSLHRH